MASAGLALLLAVAAPALASVADTPDDTAAINGEGVFALAKAGGGRTIVAGTFFAVGGEPRTNVAAILPDGTVDPSFRPTTDGKVEAVRSRPTAAGSSSGAPSRRSTVPRGPTWRPSTP